MRTVRLHALGQSVCGKRKKEHMRWGHLSKTWILPGPPVKKKKSICKPKSTIFDPRPSYMGQANPALEICTPILHGMAEPQVEEAVEGQENLVSDHVYSDTRTPQHEPYSTENLSP